jgi:5-deoxy-glucuronate isomerase
MVDVGSPETNSRRRIYHILGKNGEGRAGNLLVSELYADPGCWSGYPPHKHDEEDGDLESEFEELYHYRFNPETGIGGQFAFQPDGSSRAFMTQHGDTFLLDKGYHPTVTSPGHHKYIFTILVGKHRRSLIQKFSHEHAYLTDLIPGLKGMVDKFK